MSVLLELVVCVNNSRGSHVLLYLAARLTTVSLDGERLVLCGLYDNPDGPDRANLFLNFYLN